MYVSGEMHDEKEKILTGDAIQHGCAVRAQ